MCLSAAPILYTLFTRHLIADPKDPTWINRDRFVLSAGHGSALLYSLLHLSGYAIPMEQLQQFRQLDSLTPGHPEYGHTPGVDATAGPLGQGLAQAVGMAMAECHLAAIYPEGEQLIDHYTYVLTGDGCLEEGISHEAIAFAGLQKLNKLILLYDKNDVTLDGPLSNSDCMDVKKRFEAANWNVLEVEDGNDIEAIDKAITLAKTAKEKPTIIVCHTIIGYGSSLAGSSKCHGAPLSAEEVVKTKENLGYSFPAFNVPEEAYMAFKETLLIRGEKAHKDYDKKVLEYASKHPTEYDTFVSLMHNDISKYLFNGAPHYEPGFKDATRNTSNAFLNLVAEEVPNLFGGSADVAGSVKTKVKKFTDFTPENRVGCNINFGIRELAMTSMQNGILLHGGLRTYVGSFFVFSDYMKPAIRMACLSHVQAIYLLSHDSIAVGEDGPTHQPIEQLAMLRSIPNMDVIRPADERETYGAWFAALQSKNHPTAIILSRQNLPLLKESDGEALKRGAYVVSKEAKKTDFVLIATGSEVSLAVAAQALLLEKGIDVRVVSMPCWSYFEKQDEAYKKSVINLPKEKCVSIEMLSTFGWAKYADTNIGLDQFGASAPAKDVFKKFNFTPEFVAGVVEKLK
jgi:transketolase